MSTPSKAPSDNFGTNASYNTIPIRAHIRYIDGKPEGGGKTPNMELWRRIPTTATTQLELARERFLYSTLQKVCPWLGPTGIIRAGIVLLHADTKQPHILIIYEHPMSYIVGDTVHKLGVRAGFPKGARDEADKSALDTAFRELKEETGVDVFDPTVGAKLAQLNIVIPRSETNELFVWFIVTVSARPTVTIQTVELDHYAWTPVGSLVDLGIMTGPTTQLVRTLTKHIDLSTPRDLIDIAPTQFPVCD